MSGPGIAEELLEPAHNVRKGTAASATYIAGSLAYKAVAFLAVPVLARLLTPAELGLLDLAVVIAGVLALAAVGGLDHAVARLEPFTDVGRLWMTAMAVFVLGAVMLVSVALLLTGPVSRLVLGPDADPTLLTVGVAYGIAMAGLAMAMNAVRLYAAPREFAVLGFCLLTAEIGAAIAIAALGGPPQAILGVWTAISAVAAIAVGIRRVPRPTKFDASLARRLLLFGLPLVPSAVAWHIGEASVRATVASSADLVGLGAYGIVHRITSVLPITAAGFALAWQPLVYRAPQASQTELASRGVMLVLALLSIAALLLSALGMELIMIVGGGPYLRGATVVPTLSMAAIFSGAFTMLTIMAGLSFGTRRLAGLAVAGVILQATGAIILVPSYGLPGAAIASTGGYGLAAVGAFWTFGRTPWSMARRSIAIAALGLGGISVLISLGADAALHLRLLVAAGCIVGLCLLVLHDRQTTLALWRARGPRDSS